MNQGKNGVCPEPLTAQKVLEYQRRLKKIEPLRACHFKTLGVELRDRFGLTDREAIELLNDRNVLQIMAKYEKK